MICFKCNNEEFVVKTAQVHQDFRGDQLDVNTPVSVCRTCGWQTLGRGQADELRRRTVDAYRQNNGLLTSEEILSRRTRLGMSQHDFANFLRVGEASVKRWETWSVQDPSSDELIRMKCEFALQLQQPVPNAVQYKSALIRWIATVQPEVSITTGFYTPQSRAGSYGSNKPFILLGCQQTDHGMNPMRKPSADVSDLEYDTNPALAAAA